MDATSAGAVKSCGRGGSTASGGIDSASVRTISSVGSRYMMEVKYGSRITSGWRASAYADRTSSMLLGSSYANGTGTTAAAAASAAAAGMRAPAAPPSPPDVSTVAVSAAAASSSAAAAPAATTGSGDAR